MPPAACGIGPAAHPHPMTQVDNAMALDAPECKASPTKSNALVFDKGWDIQHHALGHAT